MSLRRLVVGISGSSAPQYGIRLLEVLRRVDSIETHLVISPGAERTIQLRTMYVLFAIELGSRRVHVLGMTRNPDSLWVVQQARNLAMTGCLEGKHILLRDRDAKFSGPFDEVFRTEGVRIMKTPIRAPRANAFAERWVRTVRSECLDWVLLLGRRHLVRVLRAYACHYNGRKPHRGLELNSPDPAPDPAPWPAHGARVRRRDLLGGLIREYELAG